MTGVIELFTASLRGVFTGIVERLPYLLVAGLVLALFLLVSRFGVRAAIRGVQRAGLAASLALLLGRIASFAFTILGFLVAATIIFPSFRPGDVLAGLGVTSVVIGFAFKDILQNFLAGILLLWKQPFRVGDEVRLAGFEGTVEAIDTRATIIKTYDGERAVLPNGDVYTRSLVVRTAFPTRRVVERVRVAYSADLDVARSAALRGLEATEGVLADPAPSVSIGELAPAAVELSLAFWTESPQKSAAKASDRALAAVKSELQAAGVEFADKNALTIVGDGLSP